MMGAWRLRRIAGKLFGSGASRSLANLAWGSQGPRCLSADADECSAFLAAVGAVEQMGASESSLVSAIRSDHARFRAKGLTIHVDAFTGVGICLPGLEEDQVPVEASSVKRKRKKKMNKHKQRKLRRRDRHRKKK